MALGTDNLKKAVKFAIDFTEQAVDSLSNGFQVTDLFSFVDELSQLPGVIKSWPDIVAELKDLDAAERQELYQYVKDNFDIPDDAVESFVENSLQWVVSSVALFEQWKTLKHKGDAGFTGDNPPPR